MLLLAIFRGHCLVDLMQGGGIARVFSGLGPNVLRQLPLTRCVSEFYHTAQHWRTNIEHRAFGTDWRVIIT